MRSKWTLVVLVSFVLVVAGGFSSSLWAQSSSTGALTGTVTDSSGAVIADATVTLINNATAQAQTTITGSNGNYRFSLLPPANYSVKVSAQGFKTSQFPSVTVNVTETPVLDAKLEVGETSQQVTVTGEAVALQTETAATGTLVASETITAIPLTTRNFTQVLTLSSGVATGVSNAANLGRGTQDVNVNGQSTLSNNYQLDGADANVWISGTATDGGHEGGTSIPNPDAISEFKIQTSQYDAGYGRNAGANVNVVTKSGGNDFHGAVFEFVRNDIFNANDFFRNSLAQSRPNFKQNQFGGALGGPIKKNKLFFFGSYQGTRQVNGLDSTSLSNVILPPLTNDRSATTLGSQFGLVALTGADAGKFASCANPTVALPATPTPRNRTFAGGTQVACDGSNINPVALTLLNRKLPDGTYEIPTPQAIITSGANAGLGQSSYSIPSLFREDQVIANADYIISPKHTLSERYFYSRIPMTKSFAEATVPGHPGKLKITDHNANVRLTSVLTNNFVNEARVGYSRDLLSSFSVGIPTAASLGMAPINKFFPQPANFIVGGQLGVFKFLGGTGTDYFSRINQVQVSDQISWVHGKQTIRTGGLFVKQYWHLLATGRSRGSLTFQNFTDVLLGQSAAQNGSPTGLSNIFSFSPQAQESNGPRGEPEAVNVAYSASAFVQDDIKVNSRLTINLGLRWEYIGPSIEATGKEGNFDPNLALQVPVPALSGTLVGNTVAANYNPNLINPYTGLPFGPPPTGVFVRATNSQFINNAPLDNFAPRVGFAWQPGSNQGRLVLRGGYGWFYNTPGGNSINTVGLSSVPFAQKLLNSGASAGFSTLQKPFPDTTLGFVARTPTSRLSDGTGGPGLKTTMIDTWSLNVQYQLVPSLVLEVGYVGSFGTHLLIQQGWNQPRLASVSNPVNCGYDGIPADCITTNTAANAALRVPIMGEVPTAVSGGTFSGNSWYHGLQTTLRKQFSHGLTAQVAYTYSKSEVETFTGNDLFTPDWGPAPFDRTHRMVISYNYELPAPSKWTGIEGAILKGWTVSGVTTAQMGTPLILTDAGGGSIYGFAGTSTIQFCPGKDKADLVTSGRVQSRLSAWYNNPVSSPVICATPALGDETIGAKATGYGNAGQGVVTGPGQFNWDISFGKTTRVGGLREDAQLQFRAEFYNAFNHPQFSNPGTARTSSATFGVITSTSVAPRLIQFGMKYIF